MDPVPSRSVFRYFMPADAFVRILVQEPVGLGLRVQPGLNRTAYRRMVIESCCPDFRDDLPGHLVEMCPHDPPAAEDLLYQLCVEVNPQLDIHTVRLGEEESPRTRTQTEDAGPDAWRERLVRRSRKLRERLGKHIVNQDEALDAVARCVRKAAAGLAHDGRPLGSFLFVGRTGTGKTELARRLAAELYASDGEAPEAGLVRVDCTEYALAHEYSKLIGAPPGYIGHDQGGFLTDAVRKRPECVVLFDEVEKAHPRLHNLLLQVLDEGRLTDSRGRPVDFTRAIVVMTSNVGAGEIQSSLHRVGFTSSPTVGESTLREITFRALEEQFSPEFMGRIDERVLFRELDERDARVIARRLLSELAARARRRGVKVAFSSAVARWVAARGFLPEAGARELKRVLQREVEGPLAELVLEEQPTREQLVRAGVRAGELSLRVEE